MSALPDKVDVVVVGAGPSGMAAALSLHKHGCTNILIVDSLLDREKEQTSRALIVHAATLEVSRRSPAHVCTTKFATHLLLCRVLMKLGSQTG